MRGEPLSQRILRFYDKLLCYFAVLSIILSLRYNWPVLVDRKFMLFIKEARENAVSRKEGKVMGGRR